MAEPSDMAATATPHSQLTEGQSQQPNKQKLVNTSQAEFQQQPTQNLHSDQEDSIANFLKLSSAFSAFQRCFAELQQHIDSISTAIDAMRPPDTTNTIPLSVPSEPEQEPSSESDPSEEEEEEEGKSPHLSELKSTRSELENICETMHGRDLRRYMISHISDINELMEQVPKALKLSPNPARLVLECLGKFYLQGSKAYVKGSSIIIGRKASILVLECFLLMGIDEGVEIEKAVKEEAEQAALAWRKRLIVEGGLRKACDMDARGLLLLIGCFGIPRRFRNEDIRDLLLANPFKKDMFGALRRSNVFMAKIPEIIEGMVRQNMEIDAVDIVYIFGIEDRFNPQRLVTSFLRESEKPLKKMKGKSEGSLADVNEAKRNHLAALRSAVKCLRRHSVDLSELLPGWQVNEKIMSLEKEISTDEEKMAKKRKNDETESSGRFSNKEAKHSHFPNPRLQQERVVNHVDSNNTLLEVGTAGQMYGYSLSPPVLHGPVGGSIHENVGSLGSHTGQLYGLPSHSYAYGPSSYLEGSTGLSNTKPGDAYRTLPYLEGSRGLPNSIPGDTYRPPSYLEGARVLPNTIPTDIAGRSSASDTYLFDDTVRASELYRSSGFRAVDVVPSAASAHHSSYLYYPR